MLPHRLTVFYLFSHLLLFFFFFFFILLFLFFFTRVGYSTDRALAQRWQELTRPYNAASALASAPLLSAPKVTGPNQSQPSLASSRLSGRGSNGAINIYEEIDYDSVGWMQMCMGEDRIQFLFYASDIF